MCHKILTIPKKEFFLRDSYFMIGRKIICYDILERKFYAPMIPHVYDAVRESETIIFKTDFKINDVLFYDGHTISTRRFFVCTSDYFKAVFDILKKLLYINYDNYKFIDNLFNNYKQMEDIKNGTF